MTRAEQRIHAATEKHGFRVDTAMWNPLYRDWEVMIADGETLLVNSAATADERFREHREWIENNAR